MAARRNDLEATGTQLAFVHPRTEAVARRFFARYGVEDVSRVSDPDHRLYRALGLRRVGLGGVVNPAVLRRGLETARAGHFWGGLVGDGLRLGGAFLVRDGAVVAEFRQQTVADKPDYAALARCETGACAIDPRMKA